MKAKLMFSMVLAAAGAICSGAEYDADANPRIDSLESGKIAFEYDAGGTITALRMNPDVGETLTLSGDRLNFADGARIIPGQNGTSRISNAISCAGTLEIGMASMTWTAAAGSALTKTEWTKLFENVRLSEISVVSAGGAGYMANKGPVLPYFVRRTGDTEMTLELQCIEKTSSTTRIRALLLELKQDGDDIYGRVSKAWYKDSSDALHYLGFCLQDTGVVDEYQYISRLTHLTTALA